MLAMAGSTDHPRAFPSTLLAAASVIAELNSLRRFGATCTDVRELLVEIDERVTIKARRLGLAPDVLGDAVDIAIDEAHVDNLTGPLQPLDIVRDLAGAQGTVLGIHRDGGWYMVAFESPRGTESHARKRETLTLLSRAKRGAA